MKKLFSRILSVIYVILIICVAGCTNSPVETSQNADLDMALEKCRNAVDAYFLQEHAHIIQTAKTTYPEGDLTVESEGWYYAQDYYLSYLQNGSWAYAYLGVNGDQYIKFNTDEKWVQDAGNGHVRTKGGTFLYMDSNPVISYEEVSNEIHVICDSTLGPDTSENGWICIASKTEIILDLAWKLKGYIVTETFLVEPEDGDPYEVSRVVTVAYSNTPANEIRQVIDDTYAQVEQQVEELVYDAAPLAVMVGNTVYITAGESIEMPEEYEISGYITEVSVGSNTFPSKNDTSNFQACVEQPYAYVGNSLALYYNGHWNICYTLEEWNQNTT